MAAPGTVPVPDRAGGLFHRATRVVADAAEPFAASRPERGGAPHRARSVSFTRLVRIWYSRRSLYHRQSWMKRSAATLTVLAVVFALGGCGAPDTPPTPSPSNGPDPATYRYSCAGPPGFLPALLERPAMAELEDHFSAQGLRDFLGDDSVGLGLLPDSGWWLVSRDEKEAHYIARLPDGAESPFGYAILQSNGARWAFATGGFCLPEVLLERRVSALWTLPSNAARPQEATVQFVVLVTDRICTGGQPVGARLLPPVITYTEGSVFIVFSARPYQGLTTCEGKPPTEALVHLREPLGNRNLLDAGVFPPADPTTP